MNKNPAISKFLGVLLLLVLAANLGACSACEREAAKEEASEEVETPNVANESVLKLFKEDASTDDEMEGLSDEDSKVAQREQELKNERLKNIASEVAQSSFRDMTDADIKQFLNDTLNAYALSCDSTILSRMFSRLYTDAVLMVFMENNYAFSRDFNKRARKASEECSAH